MKNIRKTLILLITLFSLTAYAQKENHYGLNARQYNNYRFKMYEDSLNLFNHCIELYRGLLTVKTYEDYKYFCDQPNVEHAGFQTLYAAPIKPVTAKNFDYVFIIDSKLTFLTVVIPIYKKPVLPFQYREVVVF